jgi:hypothetical protein
MGRRIVFITDSILEKEHSVSNLLYYYVDTLNAINNSEVTEIRTTQLTFLDFDLFDQGFSSIELYHEAERYGLKLGGNHWCDKYLKKEHNLFKIVRSFILNK